MFIVTQKQWCDHNININNIYTIDPKFPDYESYYCNFRSKFKGSHLIFKIRDDHKRIIWKDNKLNTDINDDLIFVDLIDFQKILKNKYVILEFILDLQPIIRVQDKIMENKYIRIINIQYNINQLFFNEKKKEFLKMKPSPLP